MSTQTSEVPNVKRILSANLTRFMEDRQISRRQLCAELDIKYTTLCDWVKGRTSPNPAALEAMSRFFGVAVADFYIEVDQPSDPFTRLLKYSGKEAVLDIELVKDLTDEQIKELLKKGFTFKRHTLEEYIEMSGKPLRVSKEHDWGEPVKGELW